MKSITSRIKNTNKNIFFGSILLIYSVTMRLLIPLWTTPSAYIDYPCGVGNDPGFPVSDEYRIAYCISFIPKETISGGGVYAYGSSKEDKLEIHETNKNQIPKRWLKTMSWWDWQREWPYWHGRLTLEREDVDNNHLVRVNNKISLSKDETYSYSRGTVTTNPWLFLVANFRVTNRGIGTQFEKYPNLLFVSGIVRESWLPSPIGMFIQLVAVGMLFYEVKKSQKANWIFLRSQATITISAIIFSISGWTIVGLDLFKFYERILAFYISFGYLFGLVSEIAVGLLLLQIGFWEQKHLEEKSPVMGLLVKVFTFVVPFLGIMYLAL